MVVGTSFVNHFSETQMKRSVSKAAIMLALAGTLLVPATPVRAAPCSAVGTTALSQGELAIEVRRLQTNLMVAALSCNARSYYNDFVRMHRPRLQHFGKAIKVEFRRRYGPNGSKELNRFITHLANEASARSNADRETFCSEAMTLFRQAETQGKLLASIVAGPSRATRTASATCDRTRAASFHPEGRNTTMQNR